jgi:hypothetical protein
MGSVSLANCSIRRGPHFIMQASVFPLKNACLRLCACA